MKILKLSEYQDLLRQQGVLREHVAFKCPICGTVQSMTDLIRVGAGKTVEEVEKYIGFSCIGRWTNAGPYLPGKTKPRTGCDWSLGGLLKLHKIEVEIPDGRKFPCFEIATSEEAKINMKMNLFNPGDGER